jgi:ApaG protein
MPSSSPALRRSVYRALLSGARLLEAELSRNETLRARELALLLRAASPRGGTGPPPVLTPSASPVTAVRAAARAAHAANETFVEDAFRTLRHLYERVQALERLVYNAPESEAVSFGVRVGVTSSCARYESASRGYVYSYNVTMTNESNDAVQLLSRRWEIYDLDGKVENVAGPGVVGEFPLLEPGDSYQYSSGGSIQGCGVGTQSGEYLFIRHSDTDDSQGAEAIVVDVAPFSLQADEEDGWTGAMSSRTVSSSGAGASGRGSSVVRALQPLPHSPPTPSSSPSAPGASASPTSSPGSSTTPPVAVAAGTNSYSRTLGRRLRRPRPKSPPGARTRFD